MPPEDPVLANTAGAHPGPAPGDFATEQTPLLPEGAQQDAPTGPEDDQEASTRELILILGTVWVGVFLAALGMGTIKPECEHY